MPRAGWCSECAKWVWVGKGDGCVNGHPRSCLQKEFEASPDPVTNEPVAPVLYPQVTPPPQNAREAAAALSTGVTSYVGAIGNRLSLKAEEIGRQNTDSANELRMQREIPVPKASASVQEPLQASTDSTPSRGHGKRWYTAALICCGVGALLSVVYYPHLEEGYPLAVFLDSILNVWSWAGVGLGVAASKKGVPAGAWMPAAIWAGGTILGVMVASI